MILNRIIALMIGYFCGIILIGYIIGRTKNEDITQKGSGNAGTTNAYRVFGWKAGVLTLLGDALKPVIAMGIVWLLFHKIGQEEIRLLQLYAGFGAVLGHNFPFYMKFKGGKGIACSCGLGLAFCPIEAPIALGLFVVIVMLTKYVSVGSIIGLLSFAVQTVVFGELGILDVTDTYRVEIYVIVGLITVLGIVRHYANVKRLFNGTENKFSLKKKEEGTAK